MPRSKQLPEWERVLEAAIRLQDVLPQATLVGGTAAALHAGHRRSLDADHVVAGLAAQFDHVLSELESVAGWRTSRRQRPVVIKGSLDGIQTTVRNLIRSEPLEVTEIETSMGSVRLPTRAEILRIKSWLALTRNATRDFLDVAALSAEIDADAILNALAPMDRLYPQDGDPGAVRQQLILQLAQPRPYDLSEVDLREYRGVRPPWQSWEAVVAQCQMIAVLMGEAVAKRRHGWTDVKTAQ